MHDKKDIVLVVDGGGMAGIFAAGALEVVSEKLYDRIHSVYATSSGADVAVYFVAGQPKIPRAFFLEYLTKDEFIRHNIFSYLFKVFVLGGRSRVIKDYINIEYFVGAAQNSNCALDLEAFEHSSTGFYVKVVNVRTGIVSYLSAKEHLPEKLKATSQCGPFSTESIVLGGEAYIDGGTLASSLDVELARANPEKTIIYVQPSPPDFFRKALLYPCYVLAACAIMRLYSVSIGWQYLKELFFDESASLKRLPNVLSIENRLGASTFTQRRDTLISLYEHGRREAARILHENTLT